MEFGYLPKSDIETGNLRSETQLMEAIKTLQRFGNIPETGIIDEATRKLMRRPRCGHPDITSSADFSATNTFRRKKRYVIQGAKWPNTRVTWRWVLFLIFNGIYNFSASERVHHWFWLDLSCKMKFYAWMCLTWQKYQHSYLYDRNDGSAVNNLNVPIKTNFSCYMKCFGFSLRTTL